VLAFEELATHYNPTSISNLDVSSCSRSVPSATKIMVIGAGPVGKADATFHVHEPSSMHSYTQ
jgi:NADPH-dependent glutamate synthase beta subunit-like oxidoreductase